MLQPVAPTPYAHTLPPGPHAAPSRQPVPLCLLPAPTLRLPLPLAPAGGLKGLHKRVWDGARSSTAEHEVVQLHYTSPEGEEVGARKEWGSGAGRAGHNAGRTVRGTRGRAPTRCKRQRCRAWGRDLGQGATALPQGRVAYYRLAVSRKKVVGRRRQ